MAKSRRDDGKQHFDLWKTLAEVPKIMATGQLPKNTSPANTNPVLKANKSTGNVPGPSSVNDGMITTNTKADTAAAARAFYAKNTPKVHNGSDKDTAARLGGDALAAPTLASAQADAGDKKAAAVTTATASDHVKAVQTILRSNGYNIAVDGIEGPQTESALQDFHSSKANSHSWNTGVAGGKGSPTVKSPVQTGAPGAVTGAGKVKTTTKKVAPGPKGQTLAQIIAGATGDQIDPSKYTVDPGKFGSSEANAQYNPQISAGKLGIAQATKQDKTNMADLTKWFGDASSLTASGAKESAANYKAAEVDQNAAGKGILAAFGGKAGVGGSSIANTAQIGSDALAQEAANTGSFDSMMKGMVGTLGASTKHSQQESDTTNIATMRNALTSLIAAKANALFTDTQAGKQQNLTNLLGITNANSQTKASAVNQAIAEAELPGTIAGQNASVANTHSEIAARAAAAQSAETSAYLKTVMDNASLQHTAAEINALHARTTGSGKSLYKNASLTDVLGVRSYLAGAIKAGNYKTPQEIAQAVKTYSPWDTTNPSVFTKVILPSLAQAGVTGVTPGMFASAG